MGANNSVSKLSLECHFFDTSVLFLGSVLSADIGKYNLPHIWDWVLFNTLELKIKKHWELQQEQVHTTLAPFGPSSTYKITENISFSLDEATLCNWQKLFYKEVKFCLLGALKNFDSTYGYKTEWETLTNIQLGTVANNPLDLLCIDFTKEDPLKDSRENMIVLMQISQAFIKPNQKALIIVKP